VETERNEEVVARDGIEPPTPAFSGLAPFILISLILFHNSLNSHLEFARLLEREWNVIRNDY
jgi:hypothetical protein